MNPQPRRAALAALALACAALWTAPAHAFLETSGEHHEADLRGFLRTAGTWTLNPDEPAILYPHDNDAQGLLIFRLLSNAYLGDAVSVELNAYQVLTSTTSLALDQPALYRSDAVAWTWNHDDQARAELAIDRLAIAWTTDHLRLTLGRQAISLAATFFFTPNDFFAPFAAADFFRAYKPGVDAVRAEITFGEFTQVQAIGVLGYRIVQDGLDRPSPDRSAAVLRASTVVGDSEVALIGARTHLGYAAGADTQATLFDWLGLRLEGHAFFPEDDPTDVHPEVALGLEHLFESSLNLQWETFYHGAGSTDSTRSLFDLARTGEASSRYLGRLYTAVGAGYELTPLLRLSTLAMLNVLDPSALALLYLLYSVSDEAELALTASLPLGRDARPFELRSEFGLYPATLMTDFRLTF